jgi:hypothetical protein
MKQYSSEKHNVAWFMLSECVSRGEKERAMGVYKLLAHSIDDKAFSRQLEGDLLWAFEDGAAATRYLEAAALYKKNKRFIEAAAVYEHLVALAPDNEEYAVGLIALYQTLNFSDTVHERLVQAIERFSASIDAKKLNNFLTLLEETDRECAVRAQQLLMDK